MMAATFGPEVALDSSVPNMDSLDRRPTRHVPKMLSIDASNLSDPAYDDVAASPRKMPPSPLPPFVFPAQSPSSAPSSFSRASGRRTKSAIDPRDPTENKERGGAPTKAGRPAALPSFSFNPGAALPSDTTTTLLSPPMSPETPSPRSIPSPSRPGGHGHRRGGSEFVGGSIRTGDSITVMSTSPTKSESGMASPGFAPPSLGEPPASGPRRHRHRRSAAISSHDISLILQPPAAANALRGSSAPTSPADFGGRRLGDSSTEPDIPPMPLTPNLPAKDTAKPQSPLSEEVPRETNPEVTPRALRAVPRARVGFSDTLEFIPRPLSLVSSDASSTATARPGGHSVSGSLSSIISTHEERVKPDVEEQQAAAPLVRSMTVQSLDSRPSTAGAILERSQSIQAAQPNAGPTRKRRNSIPTLTPLTGTSGQPEPSPTKTPKRWSFFGLEQFAAPHAPPRPRESSSGSAESVSKNTADSASNTSDNHSDSAPDTVETGKARDPAEKGNKKKKKKRKVKAWAGSILKGKSKPSGKRAKDEPQSPPMVDEQQPTVAEDDAEPAEVAVEALTSPVTPTVTVTDHSPTGSAHTKKPRSSSTPEDDASFPMIDLDAALGPFNTPLPHNPEWEAAQNAAGPGQGAGGRRQLHSAQGMKGFSGPGMHYHRRAESAPEMVPFEAVRFGINRFGSSSTMADVFEEDEEYDDTARTTTSQQPSQTTSKDVSTATSEYGDDEVTPPATTPKGPPLDEKPLQVIDAGQTRHAASMKSERSITSLHDQIIVEEPRAVEFRTESLFQDRPIKTDTAAPSPRRSPAADLAPVEVAPLTLPTPSHIPISPYSVSPGSSFPSPRSPMSYDAHRISTAPSSVNEENTFQSLLMGEPGPELRLSVDIPPSLTSSNSTMTRDSTFVPGPQPRARLPYRPDERPVSVSSAAFGRRRSSLASLSRLISSSHGERSKLSMEVSCDTEADKKQKTSKTKRLSRMMQFWKPSKESPTP